MLTFELKDDIISTDMLLFYLIKAKAYIEDIKWVLVYEREKPFHAFVSQHVQLRIQSDYQKLPARSNLFKLILNRFLFLNSAGF